MGRTPPRSSSIGDYGNAGHAESTSRHEPRNRSFSGAMLPNPFRRTRVTTAPAPLAVAGLDAPIAVRTSPRARRMSLRVDPVDGPVRVVVPRSETPRVGKACVVTGYTRWSPY